MGEILKELPAVILRGSVLLPGVVSHFDISARKSIHAVEEAMNGDNCIFLVTQKDMQTEHATQDDVYAIGVIAEIKQIVKMQNHVVRVIVEAKEKAELAYFIDNDELLKAQVVLAEESEEKEVLAPGSRGSNAACIAGRIAEILCFQSENRERIEKAGRWIK